MRDKHVLSRGHAGKCNATIPAISTSAVAVSRDCECDVNSSNSDSSSSSNSGTYRKFNGLIFHMSLIQRSFCLLYDSSMCVRVRAFM